MPQDACLIVPPPSHLTPIPPATSLAQSEAANRSLPIQSPSYTFAACSNFVKPQLQRDYYSSNTSSTNTVSNSGNPSDTHITASPSRASGQSPKLVDLLLPGTDMNACPPEFIDYRSKQSDAIFQPAPQYAPQKDTLNTEDDVEEIVREWEPEQEGWLMRLPSPSPSSSSSSSDGSRSDLFNAMYRQPTFLPGSPEQLMIRFDKQTCGILSIKDGPTENPWRTLVWPMARDSPALYHAIASMTAFHTSKEKPLLRMDGVEHMRRSIGALAADIGTMRTDTALATTLVLAFSESWDQHISTGIQHLRGAKQLVNQALVKHRTTSTVTGDNLARLKFLVNTWVYMDVIARLTSVDEDESIDFENLHASAHSLFGQSTSLDPLMGSATTLFPMIGRVANLIRKVRKCSDNSPAMISQAMDLKAQIEDWELPETFDVPEDPTSGIEDSLQTAEAYRWATLLYLHQAVPEIPSLTSAQLARKVLNYVATVPLSSRAVIVQIYPLLAAGCEAEDEETRQWVQDRWMAMASRMWIGNIDRCWEVIKEVWDRRDAHTADKRGKIVESESLPWTAKDMSPVDGAIKRKFSPDEEANRNIMGWSMGHDIYGGGKRRVMSAADGLSGVTQISSPPRKKSVDNLPAGMEPEMTVRGRLHWVGVMKDWRWEGEYGGPEPKLSMMLTLKQFFLVRWHSPSSKFCSAMARAIELCFSPRRTVNARAVLDTTSSLVRSYHISFGVSNGAHSIYIFGFFRF